MAKCGFVPTTIFLRIAAALSVVAVILFVVGFSLPVWVSYESKNDNGDRIAENSGLWGSCICVDACSCTYERKVGGILPAIQAIEAAALIGMILTAMLTAMLLCTRGDVKTLKVINLFITSSTGICTLVGVIVYAAKLNTEYEDERLGAAFILTATSGGLCLPIFCFLFIDYFTASETVEVPLNPKSEQYTRRGDNRF